METLTSSTMPPGSVAGLLDLLERSGRSVLIVDPPEPVRAAWRRRIHALRSGGHIPAGWHLLHRGRASGDLAVELRRGIHPCKRYDHAPTSRLRVPEDLRSAHPVIERLRNQPERLPNSAENRSRTLLLLQALATEAIARDYTVKPGADDVLLALAIHDDDYDIRIIEETGARWTLRLVLTLHGPARGSSRWTDTSRRRLEDNLPAVLTELRQRARLQAKRKQAARRVVEERSRQEHEQAITAHRDQMLRRQVAAWVLARDIRSHCAELSANGLPADDPWLVWALNYADGLDPLRDPPGVPPDPDPTPAPPQTCEQEQPVLGTLAHEPERRWHPNQRWYQR